MTNGEQTRENHSVEPVGWAILGAGSIARRFAEQLPAGGGRLVAVGSREPGRAQSWVEGLPASARPDAITTGHHARALDDPRVEAVYVSSVHTAHAELVLRALAAGKHVLCEKPLAPNYGTAMAMAEAAVEAGRLLVEAYTYRFHPQTAKLLELIESGSIGEISHIDAAFSFDTGNNRSGRLYDPSLGGGGILDVGGYPASMVRAIAGAAGGRAFAEPSRLVATGVIESRTEVWSVARLTFGDDLTATLRAGVQISDPSAVTVYGSSGVIRLPDPWTRASAPELVLQRVGDADERWAFPGGISHGLAARAVGEAVRGSATETTGMSIQDSLGNAKVLDLWRDAIGLRYPFEAEDADIAPVSLGTLDGRPLRAVADAPMTFGDIDGVGKRVSRLVMGVDNQPDLAHASALFDYYFSQGGNAFDTAYVYRGGAMEKRLGRWIANRGLRDEAVLIVKGAHTPFCDPDSLTRQLLESLDRLGTDYADIYLMHRDNPDIPVGEFVDVLDEHARAGRIRVFGGSNWTTARFDAANEYAAQHGRQGFAVLSNHFGLAEALDVPWEGCRHVTDRASKAWLADRRVPLLPWSSQARGFFTGRARPDERSDAELVRCYYSDANFERLERARTLADERGVDTTAVALAYVLQQPFPTFPLFGPRSIAECRSSLAGLHVELTPGELEWLDLLPQ